MTERNSNIDIKMYKFSYPTDQASEIKSILEFVRSECPSHQYTEIGSSEATLEEGISTIIGLGTKNAIDAIGGRLKGAHLQITGETFDFTDKSNA